MKELVTKDDLHSLKSDSDGSSTEKKMTPKRKYIINQNAKKVS